MPFRSGIAAQLGFADEVTVGTPVAPSLFLPMVDESLSAERERLESEAILAGRRILTSGQWNGGMHTFGGDVGLELYDRGLPKLFKHMFGAVATTGTGPFTHVFTPGDLDGKAMTVQVGKPGVGGAVHPFTYPGSKVAEWELACSQGEIATLGLTLVSMDERTNVALGVPSYPAGLKPVKFNHGSVTIDGVAVKVKGATVSGSNGLADDRRFLGQQGIDEALESELREYTGSVELEFIDLAHYNRFIAGSEHAFALIFTVGTHSLRIDGNVRYDGTSPAVGGRGLLAQTVPIKFIAPGATDGSAISATIVDNTTAA